MNRSLLVCLLWVCGESAIAQIIPDATLPENSRVTPGCLTCTIEGGTTRGVNLFHSFREFSIPTGGTAWFNHSPQIQTILGRVTGSAVSNIDGLIRTNGTANLFILNPNGIVFGNNARLEIGGSFGASTASSFKFPDGSEFSAVRPEAPPLLTVNLAPGLQYGTTPAGSTIAHRGNLVAEQNLTLAADNLDLQGHLQAGKDLTLQATNTVQIRDSLSTPFLAKAGDNLTVRGDRQVDILALNHSGHVALVSGGNLSLISDGMISGDAQFASGGTFQVRSGSGGAVPFRSLYDPIVSSVGDVEVMGDYSGAALLVESLGSVHFNGSINIDSNDSTFSPSDPDPDLAALASSNALIVRARRSSLAYAPTGLPTTENGASFESGIGEPGITITGRITTNGGPVILDTTSGEIRLNSIETFQFPGTAGRVSLFTGDGDITVASVIQAFGLSTGSGNSVRLVTQTGNILVGDELNTFSLDNGNGGNVTLLTGNGSITTNKINAFSLSGGNGGTVQLIAGDRANVLAAGNINTDSINTFASGGMGGGVTLATNTGEIQTSGILASSFGGGGNGGNIRLTTVNGNITINPEQDIQTTSIDGAGGNIRLSTGNGNITMTNLFSGSIFGDAGSVEVRATAGDIRTSDISSINATSIFKNGSSITITADAGEVFVGSLNTQSIVQGNAGTIQARSQGTMRLGDVNAWANEGNGGSITVQTDRGSLTSRSLLTYSREGRASNITLQTGGDISTYSINTTANQGSGNIIINTLGNLRLTFEDQGNLVPGELRSTIYSSDTFGVGTGGDIQISARSVSLESGAQISASTHSSGVGGNINITAAEFVRLSGTAPSNIFPGAIPAGAAGAPNELFLIGYIPIGNGLDVTPENTIYPTGIFTQTTNRSTGNAGTIALQSPQLTVEGGGTIGATTFGTGTGGNISITARDGSVVLNTGGRINSGVVGTGGSSGTIAIQTGTLDMTQAGVIQSQTIGRGNAGTIQIDASRSIRLAGDDSTIRSGSGDSQIADNQFGAGGDIRITTPQLTVVDRASLSAETFTAANGGTISVNTGQFEAAQGGQLRTTTFGSGQSGNIAATGDRFTLSDPGSGLFADTASGSTGNGGSIFVTARTLSLQQNAGIEVGSLGSGTGGNIQVQAGRVSLSDRAYLTAETAGTQGGNITIQTQTPLLLRRNSLISATAGTAQSGGDGGNITITAPFVVSVLGENSDIRANAFSGRGGNVIITAQGIFGLRFQPQDTPFSDITASSQFGVSGTVTLNTLNVDPSRGLVALPLTLVDPSRQIAQDCQPRGRDRASSFVSTGRGGIPLGPDDPLQSRSALPGWVTLEGEWEARRDGEMGRRGDGERNTSHSTLHTPDSQSLIEAQRSITLNGVTYLTAETPASFYQPSITPSTCHEVK